MADENPFTNPTLFIPMLAEKVTAAYTENLRKSLIPDPDFVGDVATDSLANRIKSNTEIAVTSGGIFGTELGNNPEIHEAFESAFTTTEELFERLNLIVPAAERFKKNGTDFIALSKAYERMQDEGLEPMIVITPDLTIENWASLYLELRGALNSYTGDTVERDALYVHPDITDQWETLVAIPSIPITQVPEVARRFEKVQHWHIRVVQGTPLPEININHRADESTYPTLNEYLTLQAIRLQAREEMLDSDRFCSSLLAGSYMRWGTLYSPAANWDPISGQLVIAKLFGYRHISNVGTRQAVVE